MHRRRCFFVDSRRGLHLRWSSLREYSPPCSSHLLLRGWENWSALTVDVTQPSLALSSCYYSLLLFSLLYLSSIHPLLLSDSQLPLFSVILLPLSTAALSWFARIILVLGPCFFSYYFSFSFDFYFPDKLSFAEVQLCINTPTSSSPQTAQDLFPALLPCLAPLCLHHLKNLNSPFNVPPWSPSWEKSEVLSFCPVIVKVATTCRQPTRMFAPRTYGGEKKKA